MEDGGWGPEEPGIRDFRDLRVWQCAVDLSLSIYRLTSLFPRSETYGLCSQMQRAAVSVPSNIAEGHQRLGTAEYLHHLSISQGSLGELFTQLEIAKRLGFAPAEEVDRCANDTLAVARQVSALCIALRRKR